jgi:hypothetical protein
MFDVQVERVFEGVDQYLLQLERRMPPEHVVSRPCHFFHSGAYVLTRQTYFVLSGGLGSSKYVQHRIWQRYGPKGHNGPQGYGMQILVSDDP